MRFMVIVKATADSEAGTPPSAQLLNEMTAFNEELVKAGILLDGGGLLPSKHAARIHFSGSDRRVVDGPFAETKELVAGYWLVELKSLDEAIAWFKRCPNPSLTEGTLEIRPLIDPAAFADISPEATAKMAELGVQISNK